MRISNLECSNIIGNGNQMKELIPREKHNSFPLFPRVPINATPHTRFQFRGNIAISLNLAKFSNRCKTRVDSYCLGRDGWKTLRGGSGKSADIRKDVSERGQAGRARPDRAGRSPVAHRAALRARRHCAAPSWQQWRLLSPSHYRFKIDTKIMEVGGPPCFFEMSE